MSRKSLLYYSSFAALPILCALLWVLELKLNGQVINRWVPHWSDLAVIGSLIVLQQLFVYRSGISQRPVLARDVTSTLVNVYVTGALTGAIVLPVLLYLEMHFLGRKMLFAKPEQLGPVWLQLLMIPLFVSFFRYWMHRTQHKVGFLWKLHSYHHRVSDLKAMNIYVSHPLDFALRNVLVFLILGIIGFNPFAVLITAPVIAMWGQFAHCGGDMKGGWLNYIFVTPEVHRWHHSAEVPEGHKYSCNYGVEFAFWDVLFGTYHVPRKNGQVVQAARLGDPSGVGDESNYLRLLLAPLGLWPAAAWCGRLVGIGSKGPQPAE